MGSNCKHTQPASYRPWLMTAFWISYLITYSSPVRADLEADGEALLAFLHGLTGSARVMNWGNSTSPCTWRGIGCNAAGDQVETLKLPGIGLYGTIQPQTLGLLSNLQVLSLRQNHLYGPLPTDLSNCTQLRRLYLQHNLLSGSIPPFVFSFTPALTTIDLSFNSLTGPIPPSLSSLLSLRILLLQNNSLSGSIPQNLTGSLTDVNLANNHLSGNIPPALQHFPGSSFSGNPGLCGPPLSLSCGPPGAATPRKHREQLNTLDIVLIIVAIVVLVLLIVSCCLLCYLKKNMKNSLHSPTSHRVLGAAEKKTDRTTGPVIDDSQEEYSSAQEPEHNKLVFFQGSSNVNFNLEDLLRASAEVLGKGSFGTTYKAVLEDGAMVVVKRLKEVAVNRKEFEQHMDSVGRLQHRNLVSLRAYYFSREEKLLVHDYYPLGSLSALLHGPKKTVLDWDTRLRVAMCTARGLAHIHGTSSKTVHGDIKSSNVLLYGEYNEARVSDYGLTGLFSPNIAVGRGAMIGYRAPEVAAETRKPTQQSDVYSFGVMLLEILTGKPPWQISAEEGMELVRWVQSVVREEWTAEVFDSVLIEYQHIEEEMVHMLQLALACVSAAPDQRPSMLEVARTIQEVRPGAHWAEDQGGHESSSSAIPAVAASYSTDEISSDLDPASLPPSKAQHGGAEAEAVERPAEIRPSEGKS